MTQIRALRGGAVGHRNRNSRLIILGGMMAMLYFLFMTLSFNVMGGATQHQQPKAPPRLPPAHARAEQRLYSRGGCSSFARLVILCGTHVHEMLTFLVQ